MPCEGLSIKEIGASYSERLAITMPEKTEFCAWADSMGIATKSLQQFMIMSFFNTQILI
jgi:hypothetical protein